MVDAAYAKHKAGDVEHAYRVYMDVLKQYARHARALHYLGLIAQQTGHTQKAVQLIARSISIDPADPRAHNHIGQVYLYAGEKRKARAAFEAAVSVGPDHVDSLNSLANILKSDGQPGRAIELYERILRLQPRSASALYNLANMYKDLGRHDEAIGLYLGAIEADSGHASAHTNLAVALEQKGRFKEAIRHHEVAIGINPSQARSVGNLIAISEYSPSDDLLDLARKLTQKPGIDSLVVAKLHYALGKRCDKLGAHDEAFDHFRKANRSRAGEQADFDIDQLQARFSEIIETFDARRLASVACGASSSPNLIFIVGLPRSGTTLTEQILASHPHVFGAGELQDIPTIVQSLGQRYPRALMRLEERNLSALRRRYTATIESIAPTDVRYVTDKLPMNFIHLGLIAMLFPEARVIHCRRNPLDVGLSCFIEQFEMQQDFSTDLTDFGRYYLQYRRLMEHWHRVLPLPHYELDYERLVQDQETEIRKLIAFCGLDWNDECLRFTKTNRPVQTPSRWQVRQPVYRSSVGRWTNYRKHLAPLIHLLEQNGYAVG